MEKEKVYICGKVTGMEVKAKSLFYLAEIYLEKQGYDTVNPMTLDHNHDKSWSSYMRVCLKTLCDCEVIFMLKNWKLSKGARLEHRIAKELGIEIIYQK